MNQGYKVNRDNIRKILVIRWGALGDLAICSAVFEDIYISFPKAKIDLCVESPWDCLFISDPRFNKIQVLGVREKPFYKSLIRWVRVIKECQYDLIIDLQGNDRSLYFLAILALSDRWRGLYVGNKSHFPYGLKATKKSPGMSALEQYRIPLRAMGLSPIIDYPIFHFSEQEKKKSTSLFYKVNPNGKRTIAIVPGSSLNGLSKRWGIKNYIDLGRLLIQKLNCLLLILGSVDELALGSEIANNIGDNAINLCGRTSLSEVYGLIDLCEFLVGNDTGLVHMASATSAKVFVICGPTDARVVKPIGSNVTALQVDIECFADKSAEECMSKMKPQEVFDIINHELNFET